MAPDRSRWEALKSRRHTALLVAIIAAFAVRPVVGDGGAGPVVFSLSFVVLMLVGLYAIQIDELAGDRDVLLAQRRRWRAVGWVLAFGAIAERVTMIMVPNRTLYLVGTIGWLLFFAFVTWTELRGVLQQKAPTNETISMAISVYLLLGVTWAILYIVLYELDPTAFNLGSAAVPSPDVPLAQLPTFPIMIYFSLTTLSTIGYGDITPVSLQARYAAVAEGITGQLYLAILVARLVGMQMAASARRDL